MYVIRTITGIIAGVCAGLDAGLGVVPGAIFAASRHGNRVGPVASNLIPHHLIVPEFQFAVVVIVPAWTDGFVIEIVFPGVGLHDSAGDGDIGTFAVLSASLAQENSRAQASRREVVRFIARILLIPDNFVTRSTVVNAVAFDSGDFAVADQTLGNQFDGNGLRGNIVFFHFSVHIMFAL